MPSPGRKQASWRMGCARSSGLRRSVVLGLAHPAALQHHDVQGRALAQLLGHQQAGPASADDDDVRRGKCFHQDSFSSDEFRRMTASLA
jgi:hypothetical protein